jgi:hypothetical protein
MGTGLDVLVVGGSLLWKQKQDDGFKENYQEQYELD